MSLNYFCHASIFNKRWQEAKDIASVVISESGASIENLENMSNYIANKINLYNISNKSIFVFLGKT